MIRAEGLEHWYQTPAGDRVQALGPLSLEIGQADMTAISGPSGSGKSTLLALLGCMIRPVAGRIWVGEREIVGLPEHFRTEFRRRHFGFVFQHLQLIGPMSALENVMLPAMPLGDPARELRQRALGLLERLGLQERHARQPVELLSGGEAQRVAIARALINRPAMLICDEPTAHLDRDNAVRFLEQLAQLRREGVGILLASHDDRVLEQSVLDAHLRLRDGLPISSEGPSC